MASLAGSGDRHDGDRLVPLGAQDYVQRVSEASKLPMPLALAQESVSRWHAAEALAAEDAGQLNSALWHLDRWIALEPNSWLPLARRARLHALLGDAAEAKSDLAAVAAQAGAETLASWHQHQAALDRITGR